MRKQWITCLVFTLVLGHQQETHAAAFALIEQSVSSMGNAYAGAAAVAQDASTIFFNPAGMTKLPLRGELDYQAIAAGHLILPSTQFKNNGSIYDPCPNVPNGPPEQPLLGSNGHNAGEPAVVGNVYCVQKFRCRNLALGLGISSPFGLVTDYGHRWVGRYFAIRSAILTININPCIAYQINNCLSVGVGFNVMYMHAKVSNAVDFGGILACTTGGQLGIPQLQDGIAIVKGNSWGYGGNAGILWEPWCGTRFGLSFRSEVKHRISGRERFRDIPEDLELIPQLANAFRNTGAKVDLTLPSIAELSGYHELDSCWALLWDISWFKWKVLNRVRFRFNNPEQPDTIITLRWKNTIRYSLGTSYRPNNRWIYRAGVAFDQAPIPNKELATPRIPDADRVWIAIGTGYHCDPNFHFDFAYARVFVPQGAQINKTGFELEEDRFRGGLKGSWVDAYIDIISAQVVWDF